MEYKYPIVLILGISVILICFFISFWIPPVEKTKYKKGKKVANTQMVKDSSIYKRIALGYKIWIIVGRIGTVITLCGLVILMAMPYQYKVMSEVIYNRDILLCMDVSTSVDDLNVNLVDQFQKNALGLEGEQIGISIFNTSSVYLVPLTSDYEYFNNELGLVKESIQMRGGELPWSYDDISIYDYVSNGTLVGNETRGSSLVGDGLASCIFHFPDNTEKERTQIVILTTDNDVYGTEIVNLTKACEIAKQKGIIVYGIAPMEPAGELKDCLEKMKAGVESTGGSFYVATDEDAVEQVMKDIKKKEGSKFEKTSQYFQLLPYKGFLIVLAGLFVTVIARKKVLG